MLTWLNNLYLYPSSQSYLFFYNLQQNYKKWGVIFFLLINIYPCFRLVYYVHQQNIQQQTSSQLSEEIKQQEKLLNSLVQYQQNRQKDHQFIEINRQLRNLIEQNSIYIENIQWKFEQGTQVQLILTQQSETIFSFIYALSKLKYLKFNSLTLSKLHQDRLIQFNAELTFRTTGEL